MPTPVAPADGATVQAGAPVTFTARGQGALVVRIARSPAVVDGCGAIAEDGGRLDGTLSPADPSLVQFTAPTGLGAGEWFWQVGSPADCTRARYGASRPKGRARPPTPAAPGKPAVSPKPSPAGTLPKLSRVAIPSRIGKSNHALLVLALGEGSPSVSRSRFVALVRNSAQRWRLDARGPVKRIPRLGDAHNDVGFAASLVSQGALGTTTLLRQNYVRVRRVCAASGCRTMRTPAGSRIVERDLALLPDVPWAQGPAHPTTEEYDLETVVLHELGHWAGNLRHTPVGCHDTPMVKGLGPGEWWRSSSDWHYDDCGRPRASALDVPARRGCTDARRDRRPLSRAGRAGGDRPSASSTKYQTSAGARASTPTRKARSASSGPPASSTTPTARSRSTASRSTTPTTSRATRSRRPDRPRRRPPRGRTQQRVSRLAWAAMDAALPPGPREPAALQTLEWVARPTAFLRRCAAAYGEAFTIRLAFDDAPLVLVWHPDAVRAVYAAHPSVAQRGASPGPLRPVAGPRSILFADGEEHLRIRRLMLASFHGERIAAYRASPTSSPSSTSPAGRAGARSRRWG